MNLSSKDFYQFDSDELTFYLGSNFFTDQNSLEIRIDYKRDISSFKKQNSDSESEDEEDMRPAFKVNIIEPPKNKNIANPK